VLSGKRRVDGCIKLRWPSSTSASVVVRHEVHIAGSKVRASRQAGNLCLFRLANDLPMAADQAAQRRLPKHLGFMRLPAEQAGNGGKWEFLGQ
jgi:hypothetical protein